MRSVHFDDRPRECGEATTRDTGAVTIVLRIELVGEALDHSDPSVS